jgi:hypothetical protein
VLYCKPQHKTQPQHTTTNMSQRSPTLQRLWPSLSMATSPWTQLLAPLLPMGPLMARCVGCTLAALLSFVWGAKTQPIKKLREGWVSVLGGQLLVGQHNNQLKVGVRGRRNIGEGARPWQNVCGADAVPLFGPAK